MTVAVITNCVALQFRVLGFCFLFFLFFHLTHHSYLLKKVVLKLIKELNTLRASLVPRH